MTQSHPHNLQRIYLVNTEKLLMMIKKYNKGIKEITDIVTDNTNNMDSIYIRV